MGRVQSKWRPSCKVSDAQGRHVNFARDPLRLYFDECQKSEIHIVY